MSLLIKEVQVVDGEGSEPYKADVLVQRNVISAIGHLKERKTDRVIEGLGHYLTPGFIDVHTNADHYLGLFADPSGKDFLGQGVTTIIGGHCGASLAPTIYGTLESIRKWADPRDINIDWHTVSEFLKALEKISLGLNFGTLAGHSTIRRSIVGDRVRLLKNEADVFAATLRGAMRDGAFGLSTGLGYVHGRNASNKELKEFAKILKRFDGVFTSHLRNDTDKLVESVDEVIDIAKSSGVTAIISHMLPSKGYEKEYKEALDKISKAHNVYFDIYPYETRVRAIYTFLPVWAQVESLEVMLERIRNRATAKLIENDLKGIPGDKIRVAGVPRHEYLVGKTISEIAKNLEMTVGQALLHVMSETNLRATVFYENVNKDLLADALMHDKALMSSHGIGTHPGEYLKHERSTNSFPEYLKIAVKDGELSLPKAIEKITSNPYLSMGTNGVIYDIKWRVNIARALDLMILANFEVAGYRSLMEKENGYKYRY